MSSAGQKLKWRHTSQTLGLDANKLPEMRTEMLENADCRHPQTNARGIVPLHGMCDHCRLIGTIPEKARTDG